MIQYSKDKFGGHLAMLATALIFGMNGPLSAVLVGSEGELLPGTHMFARFSVATVLFWCVSFFLPRTKVERKDFGRIFMASVFGVLLNQSGFAIAMSLTTPIHQSLMASLGPVFTIVLAFFILREPISLLKAGGVAFGALGVLTLLFVRTGGEGLGEGTFWVYAHPRGTFYHRRCYSDALEHAVGEIETVCPSKTTTQSTNE